MIEAPPRPIEEERLHQLEPPELRLVALLVRQALADAADPRLPGSARADARAFLLARLPSCATIGPASTLAVTRLAALALAERPKGGAR